VNQVLLERAIEASVDRPVYDDAERHRVCCKDKERVYREAELEVDTRNRYRGTL
jgi:hypothetical protein